MLQAELAADRADNAEALDALVRGENPDPFALLGVHGKGKKRIVRTFQPHAESVTLLTKNDGMPMQRIHEAGVFAALLPGRAAHYRLRVEAKGGHLAELEDPYRFQSSLGEADLYLLGEGSHEKIYATLGAHCIEQDTVPGTRFAVWAPAAYRVSVVGDFNDWDGRRHVMRRHPGNGTWEIFIPGIAPGALYKFELLDADRRLLPLKTDPLAHYYEAPPGNAAIVYRSEYRWADGDWMKKRDRGNPLERAISIYEVHLGSWRRDKENRFLGYRDLAEQLVGYVRDMGYTHIELLPVSEHPYEASWGYQPIGLYAPTQRFGTPDDFRYFVDQCHQAGIGVIVDWVPAHFPRDEHGLARFDGTTLYEYEDPRMGEHADWGTLVFNYGRREVLNYLLGSALYWISEFHIDGLRVDAVASMLYLDYSKPAGQWLPNEFGGNENFEAVEFLRRFNNAIHARGAISFAEESTTWPGVSRGVDQGGLGFTYKWNMGWMNDSLKYMAEDPINRKHHHDKLTFGLTYAFTENFVLPLSHDEVVHGKRSLLGKMPGDSWQACANLRAYFAAMFCYPGKKLLFMGNDIAQRREWSHERAVDWELLRDANHQGVHRLVRDLNRLYSGTPALHRLDCHEKGFEWIDCEDRDHSVYCWLRQDGNGNFVVCVANFTPVVRYDYRIGLPSGGPYLELINTDSTDYGGSNVGNMGKLNASDEQWHGRPCSLNLTLPPLATLILAPSTEAADA
ncbi:MAG: 1,4-alpha-glucan branching protein GlgB [Woeseiaceae bacterium]|nr:1,4-alpha-glucan branching protein GlgB [Woeseiaceae bacterium]